MKEYKCLVCETTFTSDNLLRQTSYTYLPKNSAIICDSCEPEDYQAIKSTVKAIARLCAGL